MAGDLTLQCAVYRTDSFAGQREVRLVGGFGGWRKPVSSQAYKNSAGINVSLVLGDVANTVGEKVSVSNDSSLGQHFVREAAKASRVLDQLSGSLWWSKPDGTTVVGDRVTGSVTSQFNIEDEKGDKGSIVVHTEHLADWVPGLTVTSPTLSTKTLSFIRHTFEMDGKAKMEVLYV